ncbi:S24 family peptidase [Hansschlegelia zhihuaiae]|nr:S24 family peptidase [Hansschlegelia zhihuaiae]
MSSFPDRVAQRLAETGLNPFEAARVGGLERNFINDILNGKKQSVRGANLEKLAIGLETTAGWLATGEGEKVTPEIPHAIVPIMGYVGAGSEVMPEHEQVPPEGLDQVELAFAVPDGVVGLQVRGDSMLPRFRDRDVLLVWKDQRMDAKAYLGEEVVVRTRDGKRYVKTLLRGPTPGTYNLESHNARTIEAARLDWIGEIYLIVPGKQVLEHERALRAAAARRQRDFAKRTAGMGALPFSKG